MAMIHLGYCGNTVKKLFTTKRTKDTKGSDNYHSESRALRILRGEQSNLNDTDGPYICATSSSFC